MSIVVFDIGKVLVPEGDRVPRLMSFLNDNGVEVSVDALMSGYWEFRDEYDLGLPDSEYWPKVLRAAGLNIADFADVDLTALGALDGARNAALVPETEQLLAEINNRGDHLAVLSNAPVSMVKAVSESSWGSKIGVKIFSSEVGVAKPDARIYEIAEKMLSEHYPDYERKTVAFFDDRVPNIEAARQFGWSAHLWEGVEPAREILFT